MANPLGPTANHQSSSASASVPHPLPVEGAAGFKYSAPDPQVSGVELVQVREIQDEHGKRQADVPVCTLPPIELTYLSAAGLIYVFRASWGKQEHATASDLHSGTTWARLQLNVPRWAREAAAFAVQQVARTIPPSPISPRVTECLPPTAPDRLRPTTSDPEWGRKAWAGLAPRLAPAGRLTVGAALTAPWVEPSKALTSIWSLTGQRGYGKTLLGAVCAAIYGTTDPGEGLFGGLDAAAQGLSAWLKQLAYYPPILDEAQSGTTDLSTQMRALVMGAQRRRATRSGAAAQDSGRWGGLAIVTGNDPLVDTLTHEMFGRRLIEMDARDLWANPHPETDIQDREAWWEQVGDVLPVMEGWPWQALQAQFAPGPAAREFLPRVRRHPLPAADNPGKILRLAYVGCEWLAEWTGNPAWLEGTWDEAVRIGAETTEHGLDPARDTARAIMTHRFTRPGDWSPDARERVASESEHDGTCDMPHGDDECEWWDLPGEAFRAIAPVTPHRLGGTAFVSALYREAGRLTRKAKTPTGRVRAFTVCLPACSALAWPDHDDAERASPDRPKSPPTLGSCVGCGNPARTVYDGHVLHPNCDLPPPKNKQAPAATVTSLFDTSAPVVYGHADPGEEVGEALARAVMQGITDLVGPFAWTPAKIEAAGWSPNGWRAVGGAPGRITGPSGEHIRVRRSDDPQKHATALADWVELTGQPVTTSLPSLAVKMLREHGSEAKHQPRWLLPDEIAEHWLSSDPVATPRQWANGDTTGATGWDRNKSYLPAYTAANLAPLWSWQGERFETFTGSHVPEPSRKQSGMWRIEVPKWGDDRLPSPSLAEPGSEVWIDTEVMRLYRERGIQPRVIEAVLAPVHKIGPLHAWKAEVEQRLTQTVDRPARKIAKALYQSLALKITSEDERGKRNRVYRPDWGWAISANSWANVLRQVYRAADNHGWHPVAINTDAIYYPTDEEPPGLPIGAGLGQYKREAK